MYEDGKLCGLSRFHARADLKVGLYQCRLVPTISVEADLQVGLRSIRIRMPYFGLSVIVGWMAIFRVGSKSRRQ